MCMCSGTHAAAHMWKSDENSGGLVLSLNLCMVSMNIGNLGLSSKHSSSLRNCTSPRPFEDLSFYCNLSDAKYGNGPHERARVL